MAECDGGKSRRAMQGGLPVAGGLTLLRLPPLGHGHKVDQIMFSGGVAEYFYEKQSAVFGDLGPLLASALKRRVGRLFSDFAAKRTHPRHGDRRVAVHDTGQRQHDLRIAAGSSAIAQRTCGRSRLCLGDDMIDPKAVSEAVRSPPCSSLISSTGSAPSRFSWCGPARQLSSASICSAAGCWKAWLRF